jgi:phosphoribosylanthranilate isomerase
MSRPRIKVCCIASIEEAAIAIGAGASALGLVSAMPSGPGVIDEALIAEIAAQVPPAIGSFLLTSRQDADAIIAQQRRCRCNTLQLVDQVAVPELVKLRKALPGISLVQVIHVGGPESLDEVRNIAPHVDAILLDSGNRTLPIKELGGTGRRHDWNISRQIREAIAKPLFLAGGLRPDNVGEALATVAPFGLDVCSGVRSDGRLDGEKLRAFIEAATGRDA